MSATDKNLYDNHLTEINTTTSNYFLIVLIITVISIYFSEQFSQVSPRRDKKSLISRKSPLYNIGAAVSTVRTKLQLYLLIFRKAILSCFNFDVQKLASGYSKTKIEVTNLIQNTFLSFS